jgi:hypothetical protein
MAQRRMFSLEVIDTDLFLSMPNSAQSLYFHLGMRADDDGFVSSPKKILKFVEAKEDDLKILIAKQFIIPFESGVVVITHWKLNNQIQKDRYKSTIYKKEMALLSQNENGVYNLDTECIQDVSKMETQVRLGKVSIDKNRIDNTIASDEANIIIEYFNKLFLRQYRLTPDRSKKIKLRLKSYTLDEIKKAIDNLKQSKFHNGENDRGWIATIDFLIRNDEKIDEFLNSKQSGENYYKNFNIK